MGKLSPQMGLKMQRLSSYFSRNIFLRKLKIFFLPRRFFGAFAKGFLGAFLPPIWGCFWPFFLVSLLVSLGQKWKASNPLLVRVLEAFTSCRGRGRTSTEQLVVTQSWVVDPGRVGIATSPGSMLYLSCDLHPRDKRACLPKISSPHNEVLFWKANLNELPLR